MKTVFAYITCPDKKSAVIISRHLLEKKLAACTNMFPVESMYWWNGKIESGKEIVLIAKTSDNIFASLKSEVEKIHPYKIPCVIKVPVKPNEKYLNWMAGQLKK